MKDNNKFPQNTEEDIKLTRQQQKALFLWLGQCADELRNQGLDMRKTLIAPVIPTKESMLEMVFRPIMQSMYGKGSTTELLKQGEIDSICDVIRATFADMKISLPQFPSVEGIINKQTYENYKSKHNVPRPDSISRKIL